MKDHEFNLQLFAEDAGTEPPADTVPPDGEPTPQDPTESSGSILGGAGKAPEGAPANQESNPAGAPAVYDFSEIVPQGMEYDQKSAEEFGAIARECGLSQAQASKLASYGMQYMQNGVQAAMQQLAQTRQQWGEDAKAKLGADFDKTVAQAAVGIDRLETQIPGLRSMLNETGAGNRVEMIQFMAAIGNLLGEDRGHGAPWAGGEKSIYPNTNFGLYK